MSIKQIEAKPQYHIGRDGNPNPCDASIKCPLGGEHFDTEEEAYKHIADQNKPFYTLRKTARKVKEKVGKQAKKVSDQAVRVYKSLKKKLSERKSILLQRRIIHSEIPYNTFNVAQGIPVQNSSGQYYTSVPPPYQRRRKRGFFNWGGQKWSNQQGYPQGYQSSAEFNQPGSSQPYTQGVPGDQGGPDQSGTEQQGAYSEPYNQYGGQQYAGQPYFNTSRPTTQQTQQIKQIHEQRVRKRTMPDGTPYLEISNITKVRTSNIKTDPMARGLRKYALGLRNLFQKLFVSRFTQKTHVQTEVRPLPNSTPSNIN